MIESRLHALVVDDSPEDREFYRRMLRRSLNGEISLSEAENGADGLAALGASRTDLVLLDFSLPDVDGLEFIIALRRREELADVAVVMLTGQGDERIAVEAMKRGAQDYLVKGDLTTESLGRAARNAISTMTLVRKAESLHRDIEQTLSSAAGDLNALIREVEESADVLGRRLTGARDAEVHGAIERVRRASASMRRRVESLEERVPFPPAGGSGR